MKKIVSILIVLSMLFCLFAGCGGDSSEAAVSASSATSELSENAALADTESTTEVASAAESVPAAEEPSVQDEPEPAGDLSIYPLDTDETISIYTGFQTSLTGVIEGYADWPVMKKISENTGVNVEWVCIAQSALRDNANLMFASGDYCDMGRNLTSMYTGGASKGYEDGVFMDITEYVEDYMPFYNAALDNSQWGRQYFDDRITNEDGQYFYVVTVPTAAYDMNGTSIRKDWMDALNLDTPTTIEELESLMAAMKSEYDLNNVLLVNNENYNTLFTESLNFYPGYYVVDGKVINGQIGDEYRELMARMNKWYEAGYFDSDFVSRTGNPKDPATTEAITTGKVAVFETSVTIWSTLYDAATSEGFELTTVPIITDPDDGEQHFYDLGNVVGNGGINFFVGNQHPELCAQWLDYFYTDEAADMMAYGIEGESFKYDASGKPQWDMDALTEIATNAGFSASTFAEFYYGIKGNFSCLSRADALFAFYGEKEMEAIEMLNDDSNWGDYWTLSVDYAMTTDESATAATLKNDIDTYVSNMSMQFVTGAADVNDDAIWNEYVTTIEGMDEAQVCAIYQTAYDRTVE